ncbi:MAG: DNA-binding protein, partial [Alphaproteobacteria bacterium]
ARAGVFISIDADGSLSIDRGYVRPEDEAPVDIETDGGDASQGVEGSDPAASSVQRAVITIGGQSTEAEDDEEETIKPLPERLVMELTAHRTLALRDALANNPDVALTALLHKLVTDTFQRSSTAGGCLEASVRHVFFPVQAADLKDSASAKAVNERQEAWKTDIPQEDQALWDWLDGLDDASRLALLAHCVSYGVNALFEKVDRYGGSGVSQHSLERRLGQADRLARAVRLDMVEVGWTPTVDNYLGRVTKPRILEAVREGAGERAAQLIDHLKKGDMAKEAERLLSDSGWLPEPLRLTEVEPATGSAVEGDGETEALPEFLTGDDETSADNEEDPAHLIAAE